VKLAKRSSDGRKQILKLVGPGEILGEEALFHERTYSAYARALEWTRTYFITIDEFYDFLKAHPQVALRLIEHLSQEIKGFQNKILEASYGSSLERIARLLLAIADRWGEEEDGGLSIGLELSRAELAELAGIASETASRLLARLRKRGILTLSGPKIVILDRARLGSLTEPLCVDLEELLL
jgi:CRP-like cAMP-binding protein